MFNIKEDLSVVARNTLTDADLIVTQQREALMADVDIKARQLSHDALNRFGKIMIIAAGMVTAGLFAVAAALIFAK